MASLPFRMTPIFRANKGRDNIKGDLSGLDLFLSFLNVKSDGLFAEYSRLLSSDFDARLLLGISGIFLNQKHQAGGLQGG